MSGSVVRWQIVTPKPEECAGFYSELFGWKQTRDNALGYRELKSGNGRGIDGGVWPAPPQQPGFVQLFVEVPDVDACVATATRLGASVVVPKSVLPDGDVMAVLVDPTGLSFAVCTLASRDV